LQRQKQRQEENDPHNLVLEGKAYRHFINAIRSPFTKAAYETSLKRYLNHLRLTSLDNLPLQSASPRFIESQIIDYIMSLRESGLAYATIHFMVAPIFTFYQLNDVVINRKKVSRYMGEYKRVAKDGAYTTVQIQTALQNADARMRMIILLLSSTGCRIGALPSLTLGNLTKIPDYGLLMSAVTPILDNLKDSLSLFSVLSNQNNMKLFLASTQGVKL
jgi:integrase